MDKNILLSMKTIIFNEVRTIEQFCKRGLKMNSCQDQNDQLYIQLTMNFNLQNQKCSFSQSHLCHFDPNYAKSLKKLPFSNSIIKRLFSKQVHETTSNTSFNRIESNGIKKRKSFLKNSLESKFRARIHGELILNKIENKNEVSLGKFWNQRNEKKQKKLNLKNQEERFKKYQSLRFKDVVKIIDLDSKSNLIEEGRSQGYLGILKYESFRKQLLKKIKQQLSNSNYRSSNSLDLSCQQIQRCNQAQKLQLRRKNKTLENPFEKIIKSNAERFILQKRHVMENIKKCLRVSSSEIKLKIARNQSSEIFKRLKSRSGSKLKATQTRSRVSDILFEPWIVQNTSTSFFN